MRPTEDCHSPLLSQVPECSVSRVLRSMFLEQEPAHGVASLEKQATSASPTEKEALECRSLPALWVSNINAALSQAHSPCRHPEACRISSLLAKSNLPAYVDVAVPRSPFEWPTPCQPPAPYRHPTGGPQTKPPSILGLLA